jgi:hypothetical protein
MTSTPLRNFFHKAILHNPVPNKALCKDLIAKARENQSRFLIPHPPRVFSFEINSHLTR